MGYQINMQVISCWAQNPEKAVVSSWVADARPISAWEIREAPEVCLCLVIGQAMQATLVIHCRIHNVQNKQSH